MLELLMQNWMGRGGSSANGTEGAPKPSKDFASVMGEQALSLPIQALLAEAVQVSPGKPLQSQADVLPPQLAATDLAQAQVASAEGVLNRLDRPGSEALGKFGNPMPAAVLGDTGSANAEGVLSRLDRPVSETLGKLGPPISAAGRGDKDNANAASAVNADGRLARSDAPASALVDKFGTPISAVVQGGKGNAKTASALNAEGILSSADAPVSVAVDKHGNPMPALVRGDTGRANAALAITDKDIISKTKLHASEVVGKSGNPHMLGGEQAGSGHTRPEPAAAADDILINTDPNASKAAGTWDRQLPDDGQVGVAHSTRNVVRLSTSELALAQPSLTTAMDVPQIENNELTLQESATAMEGVALPSDKPNEMGLTAASSPLSGGSEQAAQMTPQTADDLSIWTASKSAPIVTAAVPPAVPVPSPAAGPQEVMVAELAHPTNVESTNATQRFGQIPSDAASRFPAAQQLAGAVSENAAATQGPALEAQPLTEPVLDPASNKTPVNHQALAASAPAPLLVGVAELSSTLAVNSIAALDSVETGLTQTSANGLQTVAVQELAAHAMAVIRQRGHDQGDARLALHPAELGSMEMTIEQDGKRLDMSVIVDNEQARAAVSEQLNQLRERLAESGLRLASLDISLRDSDERQNNDKQEAANKHATEEAVNNPAQRVVSLSENALDLYA